MERCSIPISAPSPCSGEAPSGQRQSNLAPAAGSLARAGAGKGETAGASAGIREAGEAMSRNIYLVDGKNGFGHRRPCNDCRRDVVRAGHWYMARPEIWEGKLGLGWDDNLCLDCLEKRLGRKLRAGFGDIVP